MDKWAKLDELCLRLHGLTREEVEALREWVKAWRVIQALGKGLKWLIGALGLVAGMVTAGKTLVGLFRGGL